MPRSKHRRKKGKKLKGCSQRTSGLPEVADAATTPGFPPTRPSRERLSFWRSLLNDDAAGLFRLVLYAPLVIGAWIGGGFVLREVSSFILITAVVVLGHFFESVRQRDDIPWRGNLFALLYLSQIALLFGFYSKTHHIGAFVAGAVVTGLHHLEMRQVVESPRSLVWRSGSVVLRMGLYGILGVLSQRFTSDLGFYGIYAVLGMAPGLILVSGLFAFRSELFIKFGLERSRNVALSSGEERLRPGAASRFYILPLLTGPAIACAGVPFGIFPTIFLAAALVFIPAGRLAESFFQETQADAVVGLKTYYLAGALEVILLVAALSA